MSKHLSLNVASLLALLLVACGAARAQAVKDLAPGAPGHDAQWTNAGKEAVGTSNTAESKVWFTLRGGVLTEVYYPTVDVANTRTLEFAVTGCGGLSLESGATHRLEITDPQSLSFRQVSETEQYTLTKTYTTDPSRPVVLIEVEFRGRCRAQQSLYVYFDPSLNNSGMHDSAWTQDGALVAEDLDKASALVASGGFAETTSGYFETSDGLSELQSRGRLEHRYARAADGNVVQVGEIRAPSKFTLALGFGKEPAEALKNARASLAQGFARARAEYERGWHDYLKTIRRVGEKYQAEYDMAAMVLKAHEDKTYRGAMIASLSIPWGGGPNANEPNVGGYHLVWSRDLYQVATALLAAGDKASAERALDYLFRVQQKPDGSFPQNSWLDGRPFWSSLQMDEVSYPLVLAYQLGRTDRETYTKHVRPAADFIVRHGPSTPQERWEEKSGYSPSTIAAEIAGLTCAAEIARRNDDPPSANIYLAAADDFARNVERWTATTTGVYGDKNYYLRLSFNDDPNDGQPFDIGNGGRVYDEREIVDAGFLELVRLGVKSPQDPLVTKSLAVVDQVLKVDTPKGQTFYRYNHDGYGEMDDGRPWNWDGHYSGRGRLWALLAGERGEYELSVGMKAEAARRLDAMQGFAGVGRMIPEQVWDSPVSPRPDLKFGEGTGSATPLAWSMAQFIRLATNLQEGRNLDTPDIVAARYSKGMPPRAGADFQLPAPQILERMQAGTTFHFAASVRPAGTRAFVLFGDERTELKPDAKGNVSLDVPVAQGDAEFVFAAVSPSGATCLRRAYVRGLTPEEKEQAEQELYPPDLAARLKNASASPLVEGEDVTFIYRGDAKRVEVVGDFTGWSASGLVLREVPGAGARIIRLKFPKDARLEYKLIADGEWILDPLNSKRNDNGVGGENSFFTMPGYAPSAPAETWPTGPQMAIHSTELASRILGGTRKIQVYLPPGYLDSRARYPVLYLQDGTEYYRRANATRVAGNLIAQKKTPPFIIVLVDPAERMKDYWASDQFADFMALELVPYVDRNFRTAASRDSRALLGASLGGTISVWTALRHPETFARVGAQSPALQIDEERALAAVAKLDDDARQRYPLRFYFDAGRYEPLILDVARRAGVTLAARGYPVTYEEAAVGHNYTAWRDRLADAFMALWAK